MPNIFYKFSSNPNYMDCAYLVFESICHADGRINFPYFLPVQAFLKFLGWQY